jgi:hypothetical protein
MAWRNPYKFDKEVPEVPDTDIWDIFKDVMANTAGTSLSNAGKTIGTTIGDINQKVNTSLYNAGVGIGNYLNGKPQAPQPVTYRPKDRSYYKQPVTAFENQLLKDSPEAFYAKKVADRAKVNAQVVTAPKPVNPNAGIINRYNYYENQKTPLSAQKRVGTMGETYGTTENKLWQKAKIGSMGETYNASTAIQRYNTAYTNFKDWLKSMTIPTGYTAPTGTGTGSGYGGGYYYGGGGGGGYKPSPSPWYMELTNWKI